MTLKEKAICEVYTGVCFCRGDECGEVYKYASELMGRPIYTHELAILKDELQMLALDDFTKVCEGKYDRRGGY